LYGIEAGVPGKRFSWAGKGLVFTHVVPDGKNIALNMIPGFFFLLVLRKIMLLCSLRGNEGYAKSYPPESCKAGQRA
jgi:hypothetical protein